MPHKDEGMREINAEDARAAGAEATPETDAAVDLCHMRIGGIEGTVDVVPADFARDLERRLAAP